MLWTLTKEFTLGIQAAQSYLTSAQRLDSGETWIYAIPRFRRGVYLARQFGREKKLFQEAAESLIAAAKKAATNESDFHCVRLMQVLLHSDVGNPSEFAELSALLAKAASDTGKIAKARTYWEIEAEWRVPAKDKVGEAAARLAGAEATVLEAEMRVAGSTASYLAGAGLLSEAIVQLRQAGAPRERILELRQRLGDWQKRSLDEFQTFSTPKVNISELVVAAREHVRDSDLRTAPSQIGVR